MLKKQLNLWWVNLQLIFQPRAGSNATGSAILQVLEDLKTISYSIDASGLKDITNIAISQDTGTGRIPDVVIIRTPSAQGIMKGPISGTVAKGNFTASDLIGPLDGSRLADFVKAITDGKIVIRVSSSAFPLGEIAGKAIAGGFTGQTECTSQSNCWKHECTSQSNCWKHECTSQSNCYWNGTKYV